MARNYGKVIPTSRLYSNPSITEIEFREQLNNFRSKEGINKKKKSSYKEILVIITAVIAITGIAVGCVFLVPYLLNEVANQNKKSYQETCSIDIKCDDNKLLECPQVKGDCNCPSNSTKYKCDCKTGYFWDFDKKTCTPRKTHGESCLNSTNYQCALNTKLNCTGTCSCPSTDYWDGNDCAPKKMFGQSCKPGKNDECSSIFVCNITGFCSCPNTHYSNGTTCVAKKLYQVSCGSNNECDDSKFLECPINAGICNCPIMSAAFKCDCLEDYYWDTNAQTCVPRKNYGETCTKGSDYQCLRNKNFICDGSCTCPYVLRWTGDACDLDLYRFFTHTSTKIATSTCGNVSIANGRSIEPKNAINYVMDVVNNQVALFDADWNCNSVQPVLLPRFMKVVENDIYISTDYGLKKMDSNFNTLITLNSSLNYRRLNHDKNNNYIVANNYVQKKIDTFDRNLNLIDSFDLKALNYTQSASGVFLFNGSWFVGTEKSEVLVIRNKVILSVYSNMCTSATSPVNICIDNYGNMAIACTNDKALKLYHINGTYFNLYLNTTSQPNYLGYDSKGRIVATGGGSIDIFS